MNITDAVAQFTTQIEHDRQAVFVATVAGLQDSIKFGSAVTGAPALPVAPRMFPKSGELRDGVTVTFTDPNSAVISTVVPYALEVEDDTKGQVFSNGGPHGWKITAAGFGRVLADVTKRITGLG
jgi:hypothetical protein